MHDVHRFDTHFAGALLDDFLFLHSVVHLYFRNGDIVLHQCPCNRLGHLCRRVFRLEICLVGLHPRHSGRSAHCRIEVDQIQVVVGSQVQHCKLRQLLDGCWQVSVETEVAEVDRCHAAVGVKFHSRLVAP